VCRATDIPAAPGQRVNLPSTGPRMDISGARAAGWQARLTGGGPIFAMTEGLHGVQGVKPRIAAPGLTSKGPKVGRAEQGSDAESQLIASSRNTVQLTVLIRWEQPRGGTAFQNQPLPLLACGPDVNAKAPAPRTQAR
jgi:hypothetical protein